MAAELRHVRFRLTELIEAVQAVLGGDRTPSADEALTWYWNWAVNRGWTMQMMANQINSAVMATRIEQGGQMEWTAEEHWNVVWCGEDTGGCPDLVAEAGTLGLSEAARMVVGELVRRGWAVRNRECRRVLISSDGGSAIPIEAVAAEADYHGLEGVVVNLQEIAEGLEA